MSSRDRRRRERSWERDSRDEDRTRGGDRERDRDRDRDRDRRVNRGGHPSSGRRRDSRSRSPRRDDRRGHEWERGHEREHGHDKRERDRPRDDRRADKRDSGRRAHERDRDHDREHRGGRSETDNKMKADNHHNASQGRDPSNAAQSVPTTSEITGAAEDEQCEPGEEIEPMDVQEEDSDMMAAMMGFGGFDSTKGKPVQGNQEGSVNIKKPRTWRQYMNRRGGFNRPLDKIK